MANVIKVNDLFAKGDELAEERAGTLEAQAANREILRNLDRSGMLSEEESARLEEMYPVRTRERAVEDEEQE
jgi:hypothetical protein